MENKGIRKLTVMAMISALALIVMVLFRFNVGFLTFDFKDAVISVVSLLFGPVSAVMCTVLVAIVESFTVGDTGIYGFIMNVISSSAFVIPCGIVYKYKRSFSGAIIAAISSVISVTAVMAVANILITPYYMGVKSSDVIAMLPTLLLPFNLSKGLMNASVMVLIYKPVTNILKKTHILSSSENTTNLMSKKSLFLALGAVLIFVITALFVVYKMNGSFALFNA